jgi:hypothetical protein
VSIEMRRLELSRRLSGRAAAAALPGRAPLVDVEAQLVLLVPVHRENGVIGADQVAHAAADAGVGRIGALADPVVDAEDVRGLFRQPQRHVEDPLAVDAQLDRLHRADGGAAAAEGALFLAPEELPGQVLDA